MVCLSVDLASQVKGLHVGFTRVVDESSLIAVKHTVNTEWEELVVVSLLDELFALLGRQWIVHVKQIGESFCIIVSASHVTVLLCHDFPAVLHDERACRYFFKRE